MRSNSTRPIALLCCAAFALALATRASAQPTSGGSTYSIFNIGDLQIATTAAAAGRGGTETGTLSPALLNSVNPAAWSDLRLTTIHGGIGFDQYQVSDASGSVLQNATRLKEFAIGIPYWNKFGATFGLMLRPYSVVNYRSRLERDVQGVDTIHRASISYSGQGGISRLTFGTSFQPVPELSIGVTPHLFFGTIRSDNSVTFDGGELTSASYRTETAHSGFGVSAGVAWTPIPDLRIGAAWENGTTLDRDRVTTTLYRQASNARYIDTIGSASNQIDIPTRLSFGASFTTGRFLLSGDFTTQDWSTSGLDAARSMSRIGLGVERLPARLAASGFERWVFRFGAFMENSYYTLPGGDINAIGGTLGARIPIADGTGLNTPSALDIGLEIGTRGTTENGLTRELFSRLSVEFSLSELWFTSRKR